MVVIDFVRLSKRRIRTVCCPQDLSNTIVLKALVESLREGLQRQHQHLTQRNCDRTRFCLISFVQQSHVAKAAQPKLKRGSEMVRILIDVVAESPFGGPQAGVAAGPPSVSVMTGLKLLLPIIGIVVAIVYSLYRSRRSLPASATLSSIPSSTSSIGSTEHVTASTGRLTPGLSYAHRAG